MTVKGATERAAHPRALQHDRQSRGHTDKHSPNEQAGMNTAIRDELEGELDDGDDPIARANDGLPTPDRPNPERADALEEDPLVTQVKAKLKEEMGAPAVAEGKDQVPLAETKSTESKGYGV